MRTWKGRFGSLTEARGYLYSHVSCFNMKPLSHAHTPILKGCSEWSGVETSASVLVPGLKAHSYIKNSSMCPKKNNYQSSGSDSDSDSGPAVDWISEAIAGGSLRRVDMHHGNNGWASPPGDLFFLRSKNYLTKRQKAPAGDYLLSPAGMDWLKSNTKLDNVLGRPDNRVSLALRKAQDQGRSLKSFIFAVNLQVPGKDFHSAVFYFATEDPVPSGSLLYRFINGDDAFRNQRFKLVNRIVKGPWIVRKAVGNYSACLLGKALTCNYHRGPNYLEIDIDIGSSAIANAILHLALGYVTSVTIDMGFLVESQTEDELPERLIGAVRVCQMEMSSAKVVTDITPPIARGIGLSKVNHDKSADAEEGGKPS